MFYLMCEMFLFITCRSRSSYWNALVLLSISVLLTFVSSVIISLGFQKWCDSFVINRYVAGFSLEGGTRVPVPGYTRVSLPAYFQTEHKEIHFKCNFLPSYSPIGAPPFTSKLNETPDVVIYFVTFFNVTVSCLI